MFLTARIDHGFRWFAGNEFENSGDSMSSSGILVCLRNRDQRVLVERAMLRLFCIVPLQWRK